VKAGPLTFFLLTFITATYGQEVPVNQKKIDSLKSVVENTNGTNKARPLTELAVAMLNKDLDSSKLLFERALKIADDSEVDTVKAGIVTRYCLLAMHLGEKTMQDITW